MTTARTESIPSSDGQRFDGDLVLPDGGSGPGVLLFQEIYGVGEFLLAKAEALAGLGYVVLCPDVFWRVQRNVRLPHDEASLGTAFGYMQRFAALPEQQVTADHVLALGHLRALPEVTGRVAVMGYCLGGRLAFELAVAGDPDACVSYYGSGIADELDRAGDLRCPTLFHFGGHDDYIPMEQIDRIRQAFAGRADVEVVIQAGAGHAFENSFAPMFSVPEAAARSWPLTVSFLRHHLPTGESSS